MTSSILIVDDEPGIRYTLSKALQGHFDVILTAETGKAALQLLAEAHPEVMVLDLRLPDMSGVDVLAEARRLDPILPVLIVTAWATVDSAIEALRLGAYDYIRKPFDQLNVLRAAALRALETRRLRLENQALMQQLERSNEFKSQLFRTVAHDLRNAILPITVNIEMMRREHAQPAARVDSMALASQSLEALVSDLETYGHLSAQALTLTMHNFVLREVVNDAVRLLAADSERHPIAVSPSPLKAKADANRVRQIVINLVGNAIKHNPQGCTIEVKIRKAGKRVRVEVRDDGLGIPAGEQPHLFEPFFRGTRAEQDAVRGTGLGLPIVAALVEAHGGVMEVESTPGRGACFAFTLPGGDV
ncbi:MAG: hybrid sensor histidine kinase/response regulator [Candidatus Xenobia bacterium]